MLPSSFQQFRRMFLAALFVTYREPPKLMRILHLCLSITLWRCEFFLSIPTRQDMMGLIADYVKRIYLSVTVGYLHDVRPFVYLLAVDVQFCVRDGDAFYSPVAEFNLIHAVDVV